MYYDMHLLRVAEGCECGNSTTDEVGQHDGWPAGGTYTERGGGGGGGHVITK